MSRHSIYTSNNPIAFCPNCGDDCPRVAFEMATHVFVKCEDCNKMTQARLQELRGCLMNNGGSHKCLMMSGEIDNDVVLAPPEGGLEIGL